jgi:hypothetical protein
MSLAGISTTPAVRAQYTPSQVAACIQDFAAFGPNLDLGGVPGAVYHFDDEGLVVLDRGGLLEVVSIAELAERSEG